MPIEIAESTYPLRFDRYEILRDTGGVGEYRGSPSLVREFRYFGTDSLVQVRSDKRDHPPFGLAGGGPGDPSMTTVEHDGESTVRPVIGPSPIFGGDRFRHQLASGAGWGDPLDRDPASVLRDVRNGLVSPERAREGYGVVIVDEILDEAATTEERARRRA
jgi:N-methylhydantoinase B